MSAENIKIKSYVELTYAILDEQGEIRERVDIPIKYIHGTNSGLFPKIEAALGGHTSGETIEVVLTQEEGFGPSDPNLMFIDDINNVPPQFRKIGAEVEMQNSSGEMKQFVVSKIENGKLTVDGNHPLAGKTIKFIVTIGLVRDATQEELQHGVTQNFSTTALH
jgi:FKBP-type peptidyl-prolyl cis-trans isomerase SlyD